MLQIPALYKELYQTNCTDFVSDLFHGPRIGACNGLADLREVFPFILCYFLILTDLLGACQLTSSR